MRAVLLVTVILLAVASIPVRAELVEQTPQVQDADVQLAAQLLTPAPEVSERAVVAVHNTSRATSGFHATLQRVRELSARLLDLRDLADQQRLTKATLRGNTVRALQAVGEVYDRYTDAYAAISVIAAQREKADRGAFDLANSKANLIKAELLDRARDMYTASSTWEDQAILARDAAHSLAYARVLAQIKIGELQIAAARAEVLPLKMLHGSPPIPPAANRTSPVANATVATAAAGGAVAAQILRS